MKSLRILAPVIACLLIVLTYLLVQGAAPDAARHERALDALRTVILYNAALQRDVLRARAGLLRSYDPLVRSIESLDRATRTLPAARDIASGEARADIDRRVAAVVAAVREEEALVEAFKSDNALLRNSLNYFNYMSSRLTTEGDGLRAIEIGALMIAMSQFISDPQPEAAKAVTAALDRLARPSVNTVPGSDVLSLVSHGRLIVTRLPAVDDLVARLQTASTSEQARALQDVYLDAHGRAAARAARFQALLYIAALVLAGYVAYLFARLRHNARTLRERLEFEGLIASISTQFINLSRDRIRAGISKGLARLVEHAGLDGAQIFVSRTSDAGSSGSYFYRRPNVSTPAHLPKDMIELASRWTLKDRERQGCIHIPSVGELPEGPEKACLQAYQVRSWLCIPLWHAGERLGFLALDTVTREKRWADDDIALLRTAAEIFANAIAREHSEHERETLQARLDQSQRLEAIGTLAGGIAHEFNNILGAVLGYGEMALAVLLKESRARRYVQQIMKAGKRAQDVTEQILAFGRRRERQHHALRAEPVVAEAVDLLRASFPATLSVKTHLVAADAAMMGDPTELQQVIMNLGTNAAQAMNSRGILEIGLDTAEFAEARMLSHGNLSPGRYVGLAVRDTGSGMDQATLERIFEPFFTTKPAGQGTGLGLSTVHGIVAAHRGAVDVKSQPGEGTTFEIYFPWIEPAATDADEGEGAVTEVPVQYGNGETILVVDDDASLMQLAEEMLAALSYEPVGFDRSPAALSAFRTDPGRFDMVLTDEVMPEMTGIELSGQVHEIRPDLPIVLMTGYGRPLRSRQLTAAGISEVIKKPLLSSAVAQCIARHLH
ncbi:two-component system VirA-like sensor kinase [Mesorhizobium sp. M9A.F.Ca.ET.002.03.1.2]|uniref:two-component system VirA-like sensor kinase n=1 Tax=Mesorhizobium sp. M9A.F.Ca.ET.002.03.1.2 TaxID=2493668 RepID=UPI000F761F57|nr:two-component system VirA-like sensor kinase [Mesorhizobium sp. M9A.F.Ca.ET.002.03.1.2]AZN99802.1 two-component system VirA-like sensor kinase [Mesorhizobium sp. M9A.F.Ca.ET.002.03.1.2]